MKSETIAIVHGCLGMIASLGLFIGIRATNHETDASGAVIGSVLIAVSIWAWELAK